jgi:hypothetical protein
MRTKSVSFYMAPQDDEEFIDYIFSFRNISFIRDELLETKVYREYSDKLSLLRQPILSVSRGTPSWFIWFKNVGSRNLSWKILGGSGTYSGYYNLGLFENPFIIIDRSYERDNMIVEGELYYIESYLDDNGISHRREEELTKFYKLLAKWIRNNGIKASWDGNKPVWNCYILPHALEFYNNGGKLGEWGCRENNIIIKRSIMPLLDKTTY